MRRSIGYAAAATALALVALPLTVGTGGGTAHATGISYDQLTTMQKRLLSGSGTLALQEDADSSSNPSFNPTYTPRGNGDKGCQDNIASNVKVNANCLNITDADLNGRGQGNNGTSIAYDPNNPNLMIASDNDYRRGDTNCAASYTSDGGRSWQDSTVPTGFTRGQVANTANFGAAREYWAAASNTSVAFDTKGNAYLSCLMFTRARPTAPSSDLSSALVVYRSTQNGGASWNFPGRYVRASADVTGTHTAPFLDRQLMTVDNHVGSPFQDRVYVGWVEFAADGTTFMYEAYSADYGQTFSSPKLVSTNSPLCVNTFGVSTVAITGENSNCNHGQFAQPFTGPDGSLYIVYANYNNAEAPGDNRNQLLLVKSLDGGNTFLPPVKVSDVYDLPDCATYQQGKDAGRSCLPEKAATANSYFRTFNYPVGAVDPTDPNKVVVAFGSYLNQHSNESTGCVPTGFSAFRLPLYAGVKVPGACNNDILISVSTDAGGTFTGGTLDPRLMPVVTTEPGQATTDQWWPWLDFTRTGKLAVSYYDRQYGTDETTGFSDVSLSGSASLAHFGTKRVTSSSMPPPSQFDGTFYGDYAGMVAPDNANPVWSDTRTPEYFLCPGTATAGNPPALCTASAANAAEANDQEVRTANVAVPNG
ncbi:MAG: exo-alpha-sialidase [Jatrophihabitantaceae bacterium]